MLHTAPHVFCRIFSYGFTVAFCFHYIREIELRFYRQSRARIQIFIIKECTVWTKRRTDIQSAQQKKNTKNARYGVRARKDEYVYIHSQAATDARPTKKQQQQHNTYQEHERRRWFWIDVFFCFFCHCIYITYICFSSDNVSIRPTSGFYMVCSFTNDNRCDHNSAAHLNEWNSWRKGIIASSDRALCLKCICQSLQSETDTHRDTFREL